MACATASIQTDMPPAVIVLMDSDRIAQVLDNLLSNAHQHRVRGISTWVTPKEMEGRAMLQISNAAPPIAASALAALFDPLKRASLRTRNNPQELGLRPYIAHEALKRARRPLCYSHDGVRVIFSAELSLPRPSND